MCVFFHVFLYATGGIDKLLFAGEERMTGGTNFYLDFLVNGTGFDFIAASASCFNFVVFWVDTFSHDFVLQSVDTFHHM